MDIYFWKKSIVAQSDANLLPSGQKAHNYPTAPSPRLVKLMVETVNLITDKCSYYYYYFTWRPRLPLLKPEWADGAVDGKDSFLTFWAHHLSSRF